MSSNASTPAAAPVAQTPPSSRLDILGLLGIGFYAIFTLLPDSSSLLISWPWVFGWQVALALPWLWLMRQGWTQAMLIRLGYGLDYGVGLALFGLAGSTIFAEFPQQARWYAWAALCGIAALYALNGWCVGAQRRLQLLTVQGALSIAFILVSLSLWINQTFLPELIRLSALQAQGLQVFYDFSVLELRNWAPIGHQNYVAGYLVLSLPLLLGLSLNTKTSGCWIWRSGVFLGLIDLYTTSSRGGWLGLALIGASGILLLLGNPQIPRRWRWMGGLGLVATLGAIVLANNRLRSLFSLSTSDAGGETAFRLITNAAGWAMGIDHPLFGTGPGSVALLYQKYRPIWAGREAELVYQLHSTPAQIWAELGLWGVGLTLGGLGWVGFWGFKLWRSPLKAPDRILCWSLLAGLAGYGVVSLTDYQLDIICISGTLIFYSVVFLSLLRDQHPLQKSLGITLRCSGAPKLRWISWGMLGLLCGVGLWLTPIHRAWASSSQGFGDLDHSMSNFYINLQQARKFAPWEPYYAYELGWNLGNYSLQDGNQYFLSQGLAALKQSVDISPYQEFGYSSVGWLQLLTHQPQAVQSFLSAVHLNPAKRGAFHSLGLSLLQTGKIDLAVQAMALEVVRDPLWLTSPLWRSTDLAPLYPQVQLAVVQIYQQLLQNPPSSEFRAYLHQCLGGVYWWQGNLTGSEAQWRKDGIPLGQTMLAIATHHTPPTDVPILKAWLEPKNRTQWIETALLQAYKSQPDPKQVQAMRVGMDRSKSLDEWIQQQAPIAEYRRERAGFGVLSRHIDGPAPLDFFPVVENTAMTLFFAELLPSPSYSPDLDEMLQPLRVKLWAAITPR